MDVDLLPLRKRITNTFKLCGFLIRSENSSYLAELVHDNRQIQPNVGKENNGCFRVGTLQFL